MKSNGFGKDSLSVDKQKEIFDKLVAERMDLAEKLHNSIDFKNVIYRYKGPTANVDYNNFIDEATLFDQ